MLGSPDGQGQSRRRFLRKLGILGAGAAMGASLLSPSPVVVADGMAPIHTVSGAGRLVCLTYDDLWNEYYTLRIAETCQRRGIRITVFPVGRAVLSNNERPHRNHEELYARLREMGHEIGCHLFTHRNICQFSLQQLINEEMEPSLYELRRALGENFAPVGIRPPYGIITDAMRELAALYDIPLVMWGVDSGDALCAARLDCETACEVSDQASHAVDANGSGEAPSAACTERQCAQICMERILKNVERKVKPGSVILNHPLKNAWLALPSLLRLLERRDLQPVALTELIAAAE